MELNCLAIKRHRRIYNDVSSASLSDRYIPSKLVLHEKHDKKDKTIAFVPKLPFFRKITSVNSFLEENWLGVNFWAALNVILGPK